jgi:hypothetical protein
MNRKRSRILALVALPFFTLACPSCAGDSTLPGDASACSAGFWKPTSTRIELTSFGFFTGSTGYEKDRSQLSDAQLAALAGMCLLTASRGPATDAVSYAIKIHDRDGSVASYRATQGNVDGDPVANATVPAIEIGSLQPFLSTFQCLSASQTRESPAPTELPWSKAPTIGRDTGCLNGIFVPYGCHDVWLKLIVDAPATYELQTVNCVETINLKLHSADGTTELAAGTPGSKPNCPSLSYQFREQGTYLLEIEKTNATGCFFNTSGSAGDFFVRVSISP